VTFPTAELFPSGEIESSPNLFASLKSKYATGFNPMADLTCAALATTQPPVKNSIMAVPNEQK
jgi:hypothetical protein